MTGLYNRRRTDALKRRCTDSGNHHTISIADIHSAVATSSKDDETQTGLDNCIRILVVFKQSIFRFGLSSLLNEQSDFNIVGTAGSCEECYQKSVQRSPHVILCDMDTACTTPSESTATDFFSFQALRDALPGIPVIAIQNEESDCQILGASLNGIRGYVTTNTRREDLFKAIRVVKDGGTFLERNLQSRVLSMLNQLNNGEKLEEKILNDRERKILLLLAQGKRNQEIADEVFLSISSVKRYVSNLCNKLGASNRAEAVRIGISKHLIPAS